MDSPQETGPDTSQTIPFGGGHPTLISATIIDLAILRATVRILCFSMQIWILLVLRTWTKNIFIVCNDVKLRTGGRAAEEED